MAVLSKDEILAKITNRFSGDTDDETISLIEDVTDTFNDLSTKVNGDGKDWKSEAERIDKEWREKYIARFSSSGADDDIIPPPNEPQRKDYSFDKLFKEGVM